MMSLALAQRIQRAARPVTAQTYYRGVAYDYENQAWMVDGKYQRCGHPETMNCGCFGREHAGEPAVANADIH